ncbi:MAG TPA: hypothetical protein VNV65_04170 [Candidatus Solibacter sp.]|nr:hypothetical protein [Candidatus Solibacter sp.]
MSEASGWVDSPCAQAVGSATAASQCKVHMILLNHGGKGSGYTSVGVPLKKSNGSPADPAQCIAGIPVVAGGDYVEVSCIATVAGGLEVAAPPRVLVPTLGPESTPVSDTTWLTAAVLLLAAVIGLAAIGIGSRLRKAVP